MNPFQTAIAYIIAALTLTAILWACVRALRKRFAGEPCTGYTEEEKKYMRENSLPVHHNRHRPCYTELLVPAGPTEEELAASKARGLQPILPAFLQYQEKQAERMFPAYVKSLPDADLWAMKGLSKQLAKIRKTEMDVRRRRKAREEAKAVDVAYPLTAPGWDANGSPVVCNDNVQAALAE